MKKSSQKIIVYAKMIYSENLGTHTETARKMVRCRDDKEWGCKLPHWINVMLDDWYEQEVVIGCSYRN